MSQPCLKLDEERKRRGRAPTPVHTEPFAIAMLLLVNRHATAFLPCPTREEIVSACGVCKKRVPEFLANLVDRGLIEIEERALDSMGRQQERRMRVQLGSWTDWTARPGYPPPVAQTSASPSGGLPRARKRYAKVITTRRMP